MKISALLTSFILTGLFAHAQQKSIEVTVTDTVYLKATEFWYNIRIDDARDDIYDEPDTINTYKNYNSRRIRAAENKKRIEDSLSALLIGKGFAVVPPTAESRFVQSYDDPGFGINILANSLDSVQVLYNIIKNSPFITGHISGRKATDETAARKRLITKVLAAARVKASVIADVSKLILGAIVSVKEVEKEAGWVAYPPLSALAGNSGWHAIIDNTATMGNTRDATDDYYAISATLTVIFTAH